MKSALPSLPSLTLSSGSRAFWQNKEARVPGQEQPHGPERRWQREHPQGDQLGGVSEPRSLSLASRVDQPQRGGQNQSVKKASALGDDPTAGVWVPARTGGDPCGAQPGAGSGA